ncbi:MAG: fibronectin type III domain-containing protein [Kineosporiaceae bacterium]
MRWHARRRRRRARARLAPWAGLAFLGVAAYFSAQAQGAFTAQTGNSGTALSAAQLDPWIPTAVTTSRTAPTTCQVSWTPASGLRAGATYDITDGATTLATGVSGTSTTITVPTTQLTPHVRIRYGTWTSTATTTATTPCTGIPDPPVVTATPTDTQITATWTLPDDQGSPITTYTATTSPASQTCTVTVPAARTCTFTGLTNGTTYTVTVTATNANGTSTPGSATTIPYPAGIMTTAHLKLWLDGADPTTMYPTATCTGAIATTAVGCWKDKSTQLDHATQTVSINRPVMATVNTHPVPSFGGDSLALSAAALPTGTTASTTALVTQLTDPIPATSGSRVAFGWGTASNGAAREIGKTTAAISVGAWGSPTTSPGNWTSNTDIVLAEHATATITGWLNGRSGSTPASTSFTTGTTTAALGQDLSGARIWQGPIAEVIVLDTTLTTSQRRQVEEYLARKWATTLAPAAPGTPTGSAGDAQATLSWTAPSWDGGAAITSYTVTASPGGASCTTAGTSCTVTGLTNGTSYTFTVAATNSVGTGPSSAASAVLTPTGPPGAPTAVTATASASTSGQAGVTWTAPASNGGSAITSYTVTATASGQSTLTCATASSPCTLTGLVDGITYTITATATNAAGTSPASGSTTVTTYPATLMTGANLKLWLDGADPTTILASSTCTGTQATTTIGCWKDKSSSANHATQSAIGTLPALSTVSGHPVPTFDGLDDGLSLSVTSLPIGASDSTQFVTATLTDPTIVPGGYGSALSWGTANWGQMRQTLHEGNSTTVMTDAHSGAIGIVGGVWSATTPTVVDSEYTTGTTSRTWVSGATIGSASGSYTTGTGGAAVGRKGVQNAGAWSAWKGPIEEIVVFATTLTATQHRAIEEYLARKWTATITPGTPGTPTAAAGNAQAGVSWAAPSWDGGAAITGYTATASPGGQTCTATAPSTSCTITGLTNGTSYTVTVAATNSVGTGTASAASAAVTPAGPPGAPTGVTATAGTTTSGQAAVTWTAPASTGGSTITGYTATAVPGTAGLSNVTCTAASSPCTLTGLTDGVTYTVTVTATNAAGTGAASGSATVITYPAAVMTSGATELWLDAASSSALFTDTGCTTAATAGNSVACWKDRSTNGNNLTQSTASMKPTATSSGGRLLPVADGNDDMSSSTLTGIPSGTAASTTFIVGSVSASSGSNSWPFFSGSGGTGARRDYTYSGGTGAVSVDVNGGGATISDGTWTVNATRIMDSQFNSGTYDLVRDGRPRVSAAYAFNTSGTTSGYIFALWQGPLKEVLVLSTAPTTAQRRQIDEYLARKWSVAITPAAPGTLVAAGGSTQATVSWTAPSWDGGSAVTSYTVTSSPGSKTCTATTPAGCTVTGLTNGTAYTFTVTATNVVGAGPASAASNSVTPA